MSISYSVIQAARDDAQHQIYLADRAVRDAARLIKGRLKAGDVPAWVLADLKKELKDFNAHTGKWKGE